MTYQFVQFKGHHSAVDNLGQAATSETFDKAADLALLRTLDEELKESFLWRRAKLAPAVQGNRTSEFYFAIG